MGRENNDEMANVRANVSHDGLQNEVKPLCINIVQRHVHVVFVLVNLFQVSKQKVLSHRRKSQRGYIIANGYGSDYTGFIA